MYLESGAGDQQYGSTSGPRQRPEKVSSLPEELARDFLFRSWAHFFWTLLAANICPYTLYDKVRGVGTR